MYSTSKSKTIERIKSSAAELKQSLQKQNPWSDKINYQTQSLRNQYLALIFHSKSLNKDNNNDSIDIFNQQYARQALNLIWLDTSHAVINVYRQKLSAIDKELNQSTTTTTTTTTNIQTQKKPTTTTTTKSSRKKSNHDDKPSAYGFIARRKLVQHFRAFLRAEDTFWKSLIIRLVDQYHIHHVKDCLKTLKILTIDHHDTCSSSSVINKQHTTSNNNQSLGQGILLLHKALIYYGDLIRYTELYSRSNNQINRTTTNKSNHNNNNNFIERDWSRCKDLYNQARLLIPNDGNPSNQLAVISSYNHDEHFPDDFISSCYHYYRALSVKNPFPTAYQNLKMSFNKALLLLSPSNMDHNHVLAKFKSGFLLLHARIYLRLFNSFSELNSKVCLEFIQGLKERLLPPELILKVVVTCMAAAWHARVGWRNVPHDHQDSESERSIPATHSYTTEINATIHMLKITTSLLGVASEELSTIVDSSDLDLSENISAILRRILPTIRVISKWILCGHFNHIDRILLRLQSQTSHHVLKFYRELNQVQDEFWSQYNKTIQLIKKKFPFNVLPSLNDSIILEEDLELIGFSPIDRAITSLNTNFNVFLSSHHSLSCHPNEEHLMRLRDLQRDSHRIQAKYLDKKTPIKSIPTSTCIPVKEKEKEKEEKGTSKSSSTASGQPSDEEEEEEEEGWMEMDANEAWIDDEDPVELAMRAVVAQQMEDEDGAIIRVGRIDFDPFDSIIQEDQGQQAPLEEDGIPIPIFTNTGIKTDTQLKNYRVTNNSNNNNNTRSHSFSVLDNTSTAADLLASIIRSGPELAPPNHQYIIPSRNLSHDPSTNIFPPNTTINNTSTSTGRRTTSISLPKPSETSININIWSNLISSSSSSSASPLSPTHNGEEDGKNDNSHGHGNDIRAGGGGGAVKDDWPASTAFFG